MIKVKYLAPQTNVAGAVLHYKLWAGPTSGTEVFDYSLNGNAGTLTGTSLVYKYPGLHFAGNDEYIDTGSTFQATLRASFSISIWVKPDDGKPSATEYFVAGKDGAGADSLIQIRYTQTGLVDFLYIAEDNGGNAARTGSSVFVNEQEAWHHIVCVADSTIGGVGGKKIYFDGINQALNASSDGSTSGVTFADFTSADNLYVGAYNSDATPTGFAATVMDEILIYNKGLTAAEVRSIYETSRWRYGV